MGFTIYGYGGHLGHVNKFSFPYIQNLVKNGSVAFEKSKF